MSITMNRVNHASAADKADQAAKADFTTPVAANRRLPERAADSAAPAKQTANRNAAAADAGSGQAAPARSVFSPAPAKSAPAAKTTQSAKTDQSAEAADEASADAPVAAPFAQILTMTDLASADTGTGDGATAAPAADANNPKDANTDGAAASASTDTLPAMITSMLNAGAAPGGTLALAANARGETVSAVSTLSNSATRLNLAAASVAVNVVAPQQAAANAAAAQLQASAATVQNANTVAGAAVQGALAQQTKTDAPDAAMPAPATTADTAVPQTASATRTPPRGAETAASRPADTAPLATATVAKDESRTTAAAPAATTAGVTTAAPATPASAATVKLAGTPEQWQQPLRQALGDRLQVNLQRNNDHAVIRLEPPNMGSIEISIRHSAGSLQVNLSANNSEVLRQLNTIGDSVRQDLSTRQFSDVAVTVSASRGQGQAQSQPDGGGRNGQQRDQHDGRTPGRALSEDDAAARFAMTSEQE